MKPSHTRTLSASHKKTAYSSSSPQSNLIFDKRDRHGSFQTPDLKLNLNLTTRTPSKVSDNKKENTSLFSPGISYQTKVGATKPSLFIGKNLTGFNQVPKKHLFLSSKDSEDIDDHRIEFSERTGKNSDHDSYDKSNRETNAPNSYSRPKGTPLVGFRSPGNSELSPVDYLSKIKKSPVESKKTPPSPRTSLAFGSTAKPSSSHTKNNKKSFDFSSLYPNRKMYFSDMYAKNQPTTNTSTNETEIQSKSKTHQNEVQGQYQQQIKLALPGKIQITTSVKLNNYLAPKHKRAPSYDEANKQANIFQIRKSEIESVRRSTDSTNLKQSSFQASERKKPLHKLRFAIRSRAGATHTGARKTNQDSYIALTNFGKNPDRFLFAVCDGHGFNGHLVSSFVKETLPKFLLGDPAIESRPDVAFTTSFEMCDHRLVFCEFDTKFSGTTCVALLIEGNKIISANAGDSRAIMACHEREWDFVQLSNDHKPNLLLEAQRILKAGGRIDAFKDGEGNSVGPSRVWLRDQDIPGLAMSRSIGDGVAASVGVTCRPEVKEFSISEEDKFIVIASDGLWEFLDNIDVVKMVVPFYEQNNLEGACDFLVAQAVKKWREEEENVVDDITVIVIFLCCIYTPPFFAFCGFSTKIEKMIG